MMLAVATWVHVMCMVGAFGGLLGVQLALPAELRRRDEVARGMAKLGNVLIGLGFVAGALSYGLRHGHKLGPHFNGVIGLKFVLLLAVGALLAMSRKPGKGDLFRTICIALLALAAFSGLSLRFGVGM